MDNKKKSIIIIIAIVFIVIIFFYIKNHLVYKKEITFPKDACEIKKLEIAELDALMEEYYPPEFSFKESGDIKKSLLNTISLIEKW